MPPTTRSKNQHLLWRAGFGPMAENAESLEKMSKTDLWRLLQKTSSSEPERISPVVTKYSEDDSPTNDTAEKAQRARIRRIAFRNQIAEMNISWLSKMVNSASQLREKMSLFWHGHFATRVLNSNFQEDLLHTIRTNALGNFGDLLREVSKSPSMLQFLNNQQNRKSHPNENFAREVMELFTLGRGHYTENDIKESARAFTGWGFNAQGEFVFRRNQHDSGEKTFLGSTGNFDGNDILDILLKQKQTAIFITTKLYKFLVNENLNDKNIQWLANRFYNNNYDIGKLLDDIFTSNWFYDEENIGAIIKSPIVLLAGIRRYVPLIANNEQAFIGIQRVLGQLLFYPPNVAGWPGGKNWIDSSTLLVRLQLPLAMSAYDTIDIQPKTDDDVNMGMMREQKLDLEKNIKSASAIASQMEWETVFEIYKNVPREKLLTSIQNQLLQTSSRLNNDILSKTLNNESREKFIKSAVIHIMASPEYQMC